MPVPSPFSSPSSGSASSQSSRPQSSGSSGLSLGQFTAPLTVGGLQLSGLNNFISGDSLSGIEHAALFPLTGGLSIFAEPVRGLFSSGKDGEQRKRDRLRSALQRSRVLDKDFNISFSDGTKFNLGAENFDGGRTFEIADHSDPLNAKLIGMIDPFAAIYTGGDDQARRQLTAKLVNATRKSKNALRSAREIPQMLGITDYGQAISAIAELGRSGKILPRQRKAFISSLNQAFGGR